VGPRREVYGALAGRLTAKCRAKAVVNPEVRRTSDQRAESRYGRAMCEISDGMGVRRDRARREPRWVLVLGAACGTGALPCISVVYLRRWTLRARIAKWGNSLGVRIPKAVAKEVGLDEGTNVDVRVSGRNLVLAPAHREYSLQELVAGITAKNRHGETDWGNPVGNENW